MSRTNRVSDAKNDQLLLPAPTQCSMQTTPNQPLIIRKSGSYRTSSVRATDQFPRTAARTFPYFAMSFRPPASYGKMDRTEQFCHLVLGLCGILALGFALF